MKLTLTLLALAISLSINAQELQCALSVQSSSVQGTSKSVFENMRTALSEFVNSHLWTNDRFESKERIECTLSFNITEQVSSNEFKGTLTVQSRRPVYGSAYTTTMLNLQDNDIHFKYDEGQAIEFNASSYDSNNLIPIIAYYVYIILGMDYDSFSPSGGTEYYRKAETIVNQAQSSSYTGWKSFDGTKNRYWLINNVLDDNHKTFRTQVYTYHRRGLDQMSESVESGRTVIYNAIDELKKVKQRSSRNAYMLSIFFTAKCDEIVNIFSEAPSLEKDKVIEALGTADPGNVSKYQKIKN